MPFVVSYKCCFHSCIFILHCQKLLEIVTLFECMRSLKTDRVFAQACLCCASCAKLRCSVSLPRPKLLLRFAAMALSTAGGTLIAVVTWEGRRRKHNKRHDMSCLCHAGRMRERTTEDYWGLLFEIGLRLECPRSHSRTADNKLNETQ